MKTNITLLCLVIVVSFSSKAQDWHFISGGLQYDAVQDFDTLNGELYAAGEFTKVAYQNMTMGRANRVAKWDGKNWVPLGEGLRPDDTLSFMTTSVYDICAYKGELYAAGNFTMSGKDTVPYLAKWNGKKWLRVSNKITGKVRKLCIYNDELYMAGDIGITESNGKYSGQVLRWNGSQLSPLYIGFHVFVQAMKVYKGNLFLTGDFKKSNKNPGNGIARWNGSQLDGIGDITDPTDPFQWVYDLEIYQDNLYALGNFTQVNGAAANSIAYWNGTTWNTLNSNAINKVAINFAQPRILTAEVYNDVLYFAGVFDSVNGQHTSAGIGMWDGNTIQVLDSNKHFEVQSCKSIYALQTYHDSLLLGGKFSVNIYNNVTDSCKISGLHWTSNVVVWKRPKGLPLSVDNFFESTNLSLQVYPNPFSFETTIEFKNENFSPYSLKIFNMEGKLIRFEKSFSGNTIHFQRGDLSPGMYFIELADHKGNAERKKIIIL